MAAGIQKDWSPSLVSFQAFLDWLDDGVSSGGEKYLEMRRRLVSYFDRKNCPTSDELADETLQRVARRLAEEGRITGESPTRYCYIVAKFVFLEYIRSTERSLVNLDALSHSALCPKSLTQAAESEPGVQAESQVMDCLERCLGGLDAEQQALILEYYQGERSDKIASRRRLAGRLGLSMNALAIRACRVREKLESCMRNCCSER